ncbi:VOC family protein [Eubacteriales bacterium OttesenSCG-928-A19]|nr:VOC family protein [Eubacteriales bacterium OttesenSCG-928-A19]
MVMPYLHFQMNCEEAFTRYASIFGGKIEGISRFTPQTGSPALNGKVMHATVSLGTKGSLSGADQEEPVPQSNAMELLVHCATASEARHILDALARDGQLLSDLTPHPPPDDAGMGALVRDKYGYCWIITAPNEG